MDLASPRHALLWPKATRWFSTHAPQNVPPTLPISQLRLQEARQLMLNQNVDAGNAGGLVGYESASQFSREYSRLFGAPPQQDVRRMRLTN